MLEQSTRVSKQCQDPHGSSVKSVLGACLEENPDISSGAVNRTLTKHTIVYVSFFKLFQAQSNEHLPFEDDPFRHVDCPLLRER